MTVPSFVTEADVRTLLELEASGTSKYNAGLIASNIRSASWFLERATKRIFRNETDLTLTFTTNGEASIGLPGLRAVGSGTVALNGSNLSAGETYHLIPDAQQTGLFTAMQFRAFGTGRDGLGYLQYPDWFDRNLDSPYWRGRSFNSLPNDLVIAHAAWGYTDADLPEPVRDATKVLAAWKTLRPDAFLSGARATESGVFDLSQFPIEVQSFVSEWRIGSQVAQA